MTTTPNTERESALALYKPPFKYVKGYIYDAENHMVADNHGLAITRLRGWGRISYMKDPELLQDTVGGVVAEALTQYWQAAQAQPVQQDKDAERYRWLRDPQNDVALVLDKVSGTVGSSEEFGVAAHYTYEYRAGVELDSAIDAAIAAAPERSEDKEPT